MQLIKIAMVKAKYKTKEDILEFCEKFEKNVIKPFNSWDMKSMGYGNDTKIELSATLFLSGSGNVSVTNQAKYYANDVSFAEAAINQYVEVEGGIKIGDNLLKNELSSLSLSTKTSIENFTYMFFSNNKNQIGEISKTKISSTKSFKLGQVKAVFQRNEDDTWEFKIGRTSNSGIEYKESQKSKTVLNSMGTNPEN
jgi:hypothetical protein